VIIACPACATRYVVPDSAIGVDGRTVRCAKCRHSWFQDGPRMDRPEPAPSPEPAPVVETPPSPAGQAEPIDRQATQFDPRPPSAQPVAEPEPAPAPAESWPDPASSPADVPAFADTARERVDVVYQDSPSSFAHEPPFRPRRNPAKLWTAAAIAFALLVAALIGAVSVWGLPDWVPVARPTFGAAQPDLVLEFPPERQDRRTLPNGTEFFGASGTVTNVGQTTRKVPAILIVLRDGKDRIVYTWEVRAPKSALAPGESVTINEAVTDVPRSAKVAEIGWKP
jgi:predicted Zn finger-like uncharacterized protein